MKKRDIDKHSKSIWLIAILSISLFAPLSTLAEDHVSSIDTGTIRDHTVPLVQTPAQFKPHRQAGSFNLEEGKEITSFDAWQMNSIYPRPNIQTKQ